MKLAIFDDGRLGLVDQESATVTDVSAAVPGLKPDEDALGAGWWVRMCRDFAWLREDIEAVAAGAQVRPLDDVALRAPVLGPTKVVAAAKNNAAHVAEMEEARKKSGQGPADSDFDVFIKAPSSIIGPQDAILLPPDAVAAGREIHYEPELALVMGARARDVSPDEARDTIFGYLVALDMTVRGKGERSRRKSYDTFTPLGPWLTTRDEVPDADALDIELSINGEIRQRATTKDLLVDVAGIVAYCSRIMTLEPGDVILTGAPAGVGPVSGGDRITASISSLGQFWVDVAER